MNNSREAWLALLQGNSDALAKDQPAARDFDAHTYLLLNNMAERIVRRLRIRAPYAVDDLVCRARFALGDEGTISRYNPEKGEPWGYVWGVLLNLGHEMERETRQDRWDPRRLASRDDVAEHPFETACRKELSERVHMILNGLSAAEQQLLSKSFDLFIDRRRDDSKWTARNSVELCRLLKRLQVSMKHLAL